MNPAVVAVVLLVLAAFAGIAGSWRDARPGRAWRSVLQLVAPALLALCLFPPRSPVALRSGELVVLAPGATPAQLAALSPAASVVALPGVDAAPAIERVPDLGTALRRHADVRRLHVVGGGLPARDRDAARGLALRFDAAPSPRGVVELEAPRVVGAGAAWRVAGRVEGAPGARVALRDPSGAIAAATVVDAEGRFALPAHAKGEGTARFGLKVEAADGALVDGFEVPLVVRAGAPMRVLLLAGAPDAELKYLRRWAVDAGLALDSRIGLSEGVALNEGAPRLDAEALAATDLVIVDERSWATLAPEQKDALRSAVDGGLGLLLRATAPPSPPVAADWAALGFRLRALEATPKPVLLDRALALAGGPALARAAVDLDADDAAPLLRADDGTLLGAWRAQGEGRVAAWTLADAYRLRLQGEAVRHAALWSEVFATLARARGTPSPSFDADARVDRRSVVCGVAAGDRIEPPRADAVPLAVDARGCAAYWPASAGWHVLVSGGARHPFHVRANGEAVALDAAGDVAATRALAGDGGDEGAAVARREVAWPRWPFFLAWLAVVGVLWALERARRGRAPGPGRPG